MTRDDRESFVGARRAIVRSDERAILIFLLIISILGLVVLLYYTTLVLEGLPDVTPEDPFP